MNSVNLSSPNYTSTVQKAITRNTVNHVVEAKQSGNPIAPEEIKESNQEIKDKSIQIGLSTYQANIKKNTIDTYIQASQNASNTNSSTEDDNQEIYTFDAKEVNDTRSTVHKRAIGISIYEKIHSIKDTEESNLIVHK